MRVVMEKQMCGTASRLTPRFARCSPPAACIPSKETRCDRWCQANLLSMSLMKLFWAGKHLFCSNPVQLCTGVV